MTDYLPVIITSRMGSSRFPGKTLSKINGVPMIEFIVDRLNKSNRVSDICIATTRKKEDDELIEWVNKKGIKYFRGSENNVLNRILNAANECNYQSFIEVLGDNPIVDINMLNATFELFFNNELDYAATATNEYPIKEYPGRRFPIGSRIQIMKRSALELANKLVVSDYNKEHATTYIIENLGLFKNDLVYAENSFHNYNYPELTFAVNLQSNIELISILDKRLRNKNIEYNLSDVIKEFNSDPKLFCLMGNN